MTSGDSRQPPRAESPSTRNVRFSGRMAVSSMPTSRAIGFFYDERPCLLALFRDVTERRQAEEKLKAEQRALRRMVLASDHERHLITYELHDGVAQQLLGAMMLLSIAGTSQGRDVEERRTPTVREWTPCVMHRRKSAG